jgi:phage tail sheath gpL-like
MAIPIPEVSSNQLIGLAQVQLDRQGTSPQAASQKVAIVAQKLSAGSATTNTLVQVTSRERATALFGVGSQLAIMCHAYLYNDPQGELWAMPLADNGTTKATGSIQVTAAATGDGTIKLRVFGKRISIGVSAGDSANSIAAAIEAELDLHTYLPTVASVSTDTVTLTAKNAGVAGNTGRIEVNPDPGDVLPAGVALTITQVSGGSTDPAISTPITNMAAADIRHIVVHRTDDTIMDAFDAELVDRWSATRGKLSHAYSCLVDSVSDLTTWAGSRNSPHQTTFGLDFPPCPEWEIAAAAAGAMVKSLRNNPAVPMQDLALLDSRGQAMPGPALGSRFSDVENNTIGLQGVASLYTDAYGQLRLNATVTHYKTDGSGVADTTLRWTNNVHQVAYLIDDLKTATRQYCAGKILVDDASVIEPGTPAVDVDMIKAHLVGRYRQHAARAIVEDVEGFAANVVVERNGTDANRVDILYPPDLANQLNVLAVLMRPYLQYPEA